MHHFETIAAKYTDAEIKSGIQTLQDNLRRCRCKIKWLPAMEPVWQSNLAILQQQQQRRKTKPVTIN